ncbi:MAG: hypothetical protein R6U21_04250, partial [Thermoplasmatota archaeon]
MVLVLSLSSFLRSVRTSIFLLIPSFSLENVSISLRKYSQIYCVTTRLYSGTNCQHITAILIIIHIKSPIPIV